MHSSKVVPSFMRISQSWPLTGLCKNLLKSSYTCLSTVRHKTSYFDPPEESNKMELPERPKLRVMLKVPHLPLQVRPPKMQKNLHFMRGPEEIHNQLLYKQFGIAALGGGRLRTGHLEMIRMTISRKMDPTRMFAVWRIDDPWQPISKRGLGKRHGGGKGNIDHYVTPVKSGRILIEVAGNGVWEEVQPMLNHICKILPFKAKPVNEQILLADKKIEEIAEQKNINPYTFKYLIMNRMAGSRDWVKDIDKKYFGKFV